MSPTVYAMPSASGAATTAGRRGRPSTEGVKTTNAAILNAALTVFATKGFEGASFAEIARQAGVTRRTLYARYSDKHALLIDTVTGLIDERVHIRQVQDGDTAQNTLLNIAADLTIRSPSAPLLMRIIVAQGVDFIAGDTPLGRAGRTHLLDLIEAVMKSLMERDLLPTADARKAAQLFTDMVIGSGILSLLTYATDGTVEAVLEPRVEFFCAGFGAWADNNPAPTAGETTGSRR